MQVVLGGTEYADLVKWRDELIARMQENPAFANVQSNYEERKPQLRVAVDRDRAADLGVSLQTVVGRRSRPFSARGSSRPTSIATASTT